VSTDSPEAAPPSPASIDLSIELYRGMGYSAERIAAQLIKSGYPPGDVQQRFPDIPMSQLPAPVARAARSTKRVASTEAVSRVQERPAALGQPRADAMEVMLNRLAKRAVGATLVANAEDPSLPRASGDFEGLSFQYVPLIQCSFPHTDPGQQTVFARRNGHLEMTLSTTRPDRGLPYGVPARLLTIYCTSEAVRTRSPRIDLGSSIHEFLRLLDIPVSRGERGSLRVYANQLLRLVNCAISVVEDIRDAAGRKGLDIRQSLFFNKSRLWWDDDDGIGEGSFVVITPELYKSVLERSAPLSTAAIRQLRKSPMDLDVYAWLVHRLFNLHKPSSLSWEQLSGQIGHSYAELRYFRRFFADSLQRVLRAYPDARVKLSENGILLLPSKPHIDRRLQA
jgi:hypothetical protein